MNTTPLFWRTTHHAMLMAAFLVLGPIFDQDPKSDHNIAKLMRTTSAAQAQGTIHQIDTTAEVLQRRLRRRSAGPDRHDSHQLLRRRALREL
jgi:hypothetical protein